MRRACLSSGRISAECTVGQSAACALSDLLHRGAPLPNMIVSEVERKGVVGPSVCRASLPWHASPFASPVTASSQTRDPLRVRLHDHACAATRCLYRRCFAPSICPRMPSRARSLVGLLRSLCPFVAFVRFQIASAPLYRTRSCCWSAPGVYFMPPSSTFRIRRLRMSPILPGWRPAGCLSFRAALRAHVEKPRCLLLRKPLPEARRDWRAMHCAARAWHMLSSARPCSRIRSKQASASHSLATSLD